MATLGVHVNEGRGNEEIRPESKDEGLLMGLFSGAEVEESGTGLDGAREGGAVGVKRELAHGGEGAESF